MLPIDSYPVAARTIFPFTLALVLLLALLPGRILEMLGLGFTFSHDKLNHATAFTVLAVLGCLGWPEQRARLVVFLFVLGAAIEVLQGTQLVARDMDLFDWIADCAGVTCGLVIATWTKRIADRLR
ncbi:VanZ family protein [Mesorhizobium sp. ORM8.1]